MVPALPMVRGLDMSTLIDGQRLRALRHAKGWDQKTLAQQASVDPSVVSRLERGLQENITVAVLIGLAQSLDTSAEALLAPYRRPVEGELTHELGVEVAELQTLPTEQQHVVAAILRAYVSAVSDKPSS